MVTSPTDVKFPDISHYFRQNITPYKEAHQCLNGTYLNICDFATDGSPISSKLMSLHNTHCQSFNPSLHNMPCYKFDLRYPDNKQTNKNLCRCKGTRQCAKNTKYHTGKCLQQGNYLQGHSRSSQLQLLDRPYMSITSC